MSEFQVKVQPIFITPHNNADTLEIGHIGSLDGWQVVIRKGLYKTGDLVAYVGENAVVPEWVLKKYGYWNEAKNKGFLAGSKGDRVKAIRLRDEFSLGICIPVQHMNTRLVDIVNEQINNDSTYFIVVDTIVGEDFISVVEGEDVADILGVKKYDPPIPVELAGEVYNGGTNIGVNYDIENSKNYPDAFVNGEDVQVTEKIHGSYGMIVIMPLTQEFHTENHQVVISPSGQSCYAAVASKGLGAKGLFLKHNEKNANNVYLRVTKPYFETLATIGAQSPITICGEVFGNGVQDLKYGYKSGEIDFRVFDVYIGRRGQGHWLEDLQLDEFCTTYNMKRVPILYRGPFSKEKMLELSQNTNSVFDVNQISEGIVVATNPTRFISGLGRLKLKFINEAYYTRKNGTEFN